MATLNMVQTVKNALADEMRIDERVVVFGEDVGKAGGVFLATQGLQDEFGPERSFDTPLAENGILGTAIGLALAGFRPVAEIQFIDFVYPGFDMVVSEMAKYRYRSGGEFSVPMVLRSPWGGGIRGGQYHSQSPEAYFVHTPGLKVVVPSNPHDLKGLLIAAIRDPDPVIFLEPKKLYRAVKGEVPDGAYVEPLGVAKVTKEGKDVTVVAYGTMLHMAMEAAEKAGNEGVDAEVIDLRTLLPYDAPAVLESVKKTGRAVLVQEAPKICGFAAELSALIAEEAIDYLYAPVVRVAGYDTPYPYAQDSHYLPNADRILRAIKKVMEH
jgi:2-oxoisovalerate dehydrogenase E1 component beta subunit